MVKKEIVNCVYPLLRPGVCFSPFNFDCFGVLCSPLFPRTKDKTYTNMVKETIISTGSPWGIPFHRGPCPMHYLSIRNKTEKGPEVQCFFIDNPCHFCGIQLLYNPNSTNIHVRRLSSIDALGPDLSKIVCMGCMSCNERVYSVRHQPLSTCATVSLPSDP